MRLNLPPVSEFTDNFLQAVIDQIQSWANGKIDTSNVATGTFVEVKPSGTATKQSSGASTLTWGGVTAKSNVLTVTHNLGATPTKVLATQSGGTAPAFFVIFAWGNAGGTTFDIVGAPPAGVPGAGATATFSWTAIAP